VFVAVVVQFNHPQAPIMSRELLQRLLRIGHRGIHIRLEFLESSSENIRRHFRPEMKKCGPDF
jgi:hypothetical protein